MSRLRSGTYSFRRYVAPAFCKLCRGSRVFTESVCLYNYHSLLFPFMAVRKTPITLLNRLIFMAMSCGLATLAQAIIDVDGDGLDDVWQERFGAGDLTPEGDADGDGQTNLMECVAGTDPYDGTKMYQFSEQMLDETGTMWVTWDTQVGKLYQMEIADTPSDLAFIDFGPSLHGTGDSLTVRFEEGENPEIVGAVFHELWIGIRGINALNAKLTDGTPPDATQALTQTEIPAGVADYYGGRMRGYIVPPASGDYRFYLESGGDSELWLSTTDDIDVIKQEKPTDLTEPGWSQVFDRVSLVEGVPRYFEVRHVQGVGLDHAKLGWKGTDADEIAVVPSKVLKPYVEGIVAGLGIDGMRKFFRVRVADQDQDGDGITDWAEAQLPGDGVFFFADAESTNGRNDGALLSAALVGIDDPDVVSLSVADDAAYEDNAPLGGDDHGSMVLQRSGGLQPLSVSIASEIVAAPEEAAEPSDYSLERPDGTVVKTVVTLPFGVLSYPLTVKANPDSDHEFRETVRRRLQASPTGEYELDLQDVADVLLYDFPDHPDNTTLFVGSFSKDGKCAGETNGNGFASAVLNGPKTELLLANQFNNLTSPQQDSHVHKSNPGNTPGNIIYAVTNEPGGESGPEPGALPYIGEIQAYPWDLTGSTGSLGKQAVIESLFQVNGETPLYLNIHTVNEPAGEIWAFLTETSGTSSDPGDADPYDPYSQLSGVALEQEVRRFLNQATFGATDGDVADLLGAILTERLTNAGYHRETAFEAWIDAQMAVPQTFLKDQVLAADQQEWKLRGYFDSSRNPSATYQGNMINTPALPSTWATLDRMSANPEEWYPTVDYPLSNQEIQLGQQVNGLGQPQGNNRRRGLWNVYLNANDQLRQKMGYALQQIVVTSASANTLSQRGLSTAHYMDMLAYHAFDHYRDILGYANWSPVMGRWLSSLKNQQAFDSNMDGEDDVFPDENLARENMQLFSIGLFVLWSDGSLKLGNDGLPTPTYTNDDIQEFARVLTGQSFSKYADSKEQWGVSSLNELVENTNFNKNNGSQYYGHQYNYPMKMFGIYHDPGVKTMAGGKEIDNTAIADLAVRGIADIEAAIDWLAGKPGDGLPDFDMGTSHQSTPAFISRRLIQRFVTSNPTRDYLHRVATAFKESEGDLGETIKAILLDPEARVPDISSTVFGMKKPPLEAHMQLLRAFDSYTLIPMETSTDSPFDTAPGDYSNTDIYLTNFGYPTSEVAKFKFNARYSFFSTHTGETAALDMTPYRQATVFNWYLPDYSPGGPIASAAMVSPEMQLANEVGVIKNINFIRPFPIQWNTSTGAKGQYLTPLGGNQGNQRLAFGQIGEGPWDHNARVRMDSQDWADLLYPSPEPTPTATRTAESLADEMLLDELDERLTLGFFKERYPYDPSDDDDPNIAGVDDLLKNPREIVIDYLTAAFGNPYNNPSNDPSDRLAKFRYGVHMLSTTPEYLIKK